MGLPEFYSASLPACHGLWTPPDLRTLAFPGALVLPSVNVETLGVRNKLISKLYQHFTGCASPLRPTGYSVYASPTLFAAFRRLRHGRNTRYGWVASPYPTGTFTPQETLSLSQRDNARAKGRGRTKLGETGQSVTPRPLERRVGRSRYAEKAIPICLSKT